MVRRGGILGRPQRIALTFSELTGEPHPDVRRGDVAVCVCAPGDAERLADCIAALRAHTDPGHALLGVGSGNGAAATVAELGHALTVAAPADIAVVAGGCLVAAGWLEGLRAAAGSDPRVAVISALGPETPLPSSPCVLIRRAALELVGPLDSSLGIPQALVDFAQRCLAHGLRHVLADDVLVEGGQGGEDAVVDDILARRYPYLRAWNEALAADRDAPSAPAPGPGGRLPSVTIDGRCLSTSVAGTAVATLDLVEGLRRHADLSVRVLVLDDLEVSIRDRLTALGVTLLLESEAEAADATDVAHRPYQLGAPQDLLLLRRLGRRLVVTQLDWIAYRTPAYFETPARWQEYRELTEATLAAADEVVFISDDAARDGRALGLVDERRSTVIPLAVDDRPGAAQPSERMGTNPAQLQDRPYLLCLGTDFAHKNRPFALRLLGALRDGENFDGILVLAGPHVPVGSSAEDEAALLAADPSLADRVVDLGQVGEAEKRRLLRHAAAVVYPTTFEGFGLIPFEAARAGVPALFAWTSALREHLPEELALLVPWDPAASARRVAPVLVPGEARERQVRSVLEAGASLTSAENARRHAKLYDAVRGEPVAPAGRVGLRVAELLVSQARLRDDVAAYHRALSAIYDDPIASGFVGPHAIVPEELQRALLALTGRPALRDRAVALYRASRSVAGRFR